MKKTILKTFVVVIMTILFVNTITFSNNITNTTKKVIGIVYDDSWSMVSNGEDYAYANYAVQNIIAFMNETDELFVVKMSDKYNFETIDVKSKNVKASNILETEKWDSFADETPFEAVETAIEHMKDLKSIYGTSDNTEYFLIVLTDGGFEGMPSDLTSYLNNVSDFMSDVLYESIWICVGSKSSYSSFMSKLSGANNTSSISTNNKDGISKALFDTMQKIYGRISKKDKDIEGRNNRVSINYEYPISKIIVYEQDQAVALKSVHSSDGNIYTNATIYSPKKNNQNGKLKLKSNIIEINGNNKSIKEGKIDLEFEDSIDISENKLQIIVEPALGLDLYVINESGDKETDLNKYMDGDSLGFIAKPINIYDNSFIDLSNEVNNITSSYTFDGKSDRLIFDDSIKAYRFSENVTTGNNVFSAQIERSGYFKIKSNVVNISVPLDRYVLPKLTKDVVNVSNTLDKKYNVVDSFDYVLENLTNKSNGTIEFSDIPKGIQVKVNGNTVKNRKVNLTLNEKNNIEILRNKDYNNEQNSVISFNVNFNDKSIKVKDSGVRFTLEPIIRNLSVKTEKLHDILHTGNAYGKSLYRLIPFVDNANVTMDEIKKSKIEFENLADKVKWNSKIVSANGQNVIDINLKKSILPFYMFQNKNIKTKIIYNSPFGEQVEEIVEFNINANILSAILSILVPLLIIIYIFGLIKKPRFDSKYHKFKIEKDGKVEESIIIKSGGLGSIIPFVAEKGSVYDLKLKADADSKRIVVLKKSLTEDMSYDTDDVDVTKDKIIYEETPLIKKEGRNKILYIYHDVRNEILEDKNTSRRRGRRR